MVAKKNPTYAGGWGISHDAGTHCLAIASFHEEAFDTPRALLLLRRSPLTVTTDGEGKYTVVDLRPGVYVVTFSLQGFATVKREGLELPSNFDVNARLPHGIRMFGGTSTEKTVSNSCSAASTDPNLLLYCDGSKNGIPWITAGKIAGTVPLPWYGITFSGSLQALDFIGIFNSTVK